MTEEQKAEEYAENFKSLNIDLFNDVKQAFKDGYHECEKDHEWHYVDKEELPDDQRKVEVFTKDKDIFIAVIDSESEEWYTGRYFGQVISMEQVIAWREHYPPKEVE